MIFFSCGPTFLPLVGPQDIYEILKKAKQLGGDIGTLQELNDLVYVLCQVFQKYREWFDAYAIIDPNTKQKTFLPIITQKHKIITNAHYSPGVLIKKLLKKSFATNVQLENYLQTEGCGTEIG